MSTKTVLQTLFFCTAFVFSTGCQSDNESPDLTSEPPDLTCEDWGYEQDNGPAQWATLCHATCAGTQQSPIDIVTAGTVEQDLPEIVFHYNATQMVLFNNGHTIEAADEHEPKTNTIEINGKVYELLQFHFHSLSEHTIDGQHSPIEMHLVHKFSPTDLAVIGVMIDQGADNAAFASIWSQLPAEATTPQVEVDVDVLSLLPANRDYYRYDGSLTTPNGSTPSASCAEIVNWVVMKNAIEMSPAQITAFRAIFDANTRPVQPLNGRTVSE